jgi:hypothetical protein
VKFDVCVSFISMREGFLSEFVKFWSRGKSQTSYIPQNRDALNKKDATLHIINLDTNVEVSGILYIPANLLVYTLNRGLPRIKT